MSLFTLLFLCTWEGWAQDMKLPEERELDVVDFQHVKDVLTKDGLQQEVQRKQREVEEIQKLRLEEEKKRYQWPSEEEIWPLAGEFWLVKQAPLLKWDFDRPEYGLDITFSSVLKSVGLVQKKFRILAIDAPHPAHFGLPWRSDEFCVLFSVPFARSLDLNKLEISLLLLEDVLRVQEGWVAEFARPPQLAKLVGSNFYGSKADISPIHEIAKSYSKFIAEKGFSFQQQFAITKKMNQILRPHPELWNAYVRMLGKIDRLLKGNAAFSDYVKLYPSPEMQIRWLAPEEKIP